MKLEFAKRRLSDDVVKELTQRSFERFKVESGVFESASRQRDYSGNVLCLKFNTQLTSRDRSCKAPVIPSPEPPH